MVTGSRSRGHVKNGEWVPHGSYDAYGNFREHGKVDGAGRWVPGHYDQNGTLVPNGQYDPQGRWFPFGRTDEGAAGFRCASTARSSPGPDAHDELPNDGSPSDQGFGQDYLRSPDYRADAEVENAMRENYEEHGWRDDIDVFAREIEPRIRGLENSDPELAKIIREIPFEQQVALRGYAKHSFDLINKYLRT